jgi:hypothetical protein
VVGVGVIRPGSQNARLLETLRAGPATNREIHLHAGHMIVNSRVAELRAHGYRIVCEHTGGKGADAYRYSLLSEPGIPTDRPSAPGSESSDPVVVEPDGQLALVEAA